MQKCFAFRQERDRSKKLQEQYKEALEKLKVSSFVGGPDYEVLHCYKSLLTID